MNWIDLVVAAGVGVSTRLLTRVIKIGKLAVRLALIGLAIIVALILLQQAK